MIRALLRGREALAAHVFQEDERPGGLGVALLALGATLPVLLATSPTVAITTMAWDIFVPLDGGWRVAQGQRPHLDFHTPVGPLYVWAYGLATRAFGTDGRVVLLVPAMVAPLVAALGLHLTRGRLPGLLRVAVALLVGLLALSPVHLDQPQLAHLASYNRVGSALALLAAIGACLAPRGPARLRTADVAALALLLAALFYLKVTLFGLALGALGLAVLLVPATRATNLAAAGLAAVAIGLPFALSPLPAAYLADVKRAIDAHDPAIDAAYAAAGFAHILPGPVKLALQLGANAGTVLLALLGAVALARTATSDDEARAATRAALVVLGLVGGTLVVALQNHDLYAPGLFAAVLVAVQGIVRQRGRRLWTEAVVALALLLIAARALHDVRGVVAHAALSRRTEASWAVAPPGRPGSALRLVGGGEGTLRHVLDGRVELDDWNLLEDPGPADLALLLREGVAALDAHAAPDAKVVSLMFSAPFPYLRGSPPPRRTLAWYHAGRTFGGGFRLDPDVFLADTDVVAVSKLRDNAEGEPPRTPADIERDLLWEMLGDAITRDFERVETPLWTLWVRR